MSSALRGVRSQTGGCVRIFDETTPQKQQRTAYDAVDREDETTADVIVGVGGGSGLDVARQMNTLAADWQSPDELVTLARDDTLSGLGTPDFNTPVTIVPAMFAGVDA